ncbi:hyaluronate lyase [Paenibacillus sp. LMG 31461]|uniref:Hyaluronate lyase n=1 Tax=Paenibacillus plantarum TaxID=2654975 RepID=A0ABX1XEG5_9BACL|nr:polysaccharide lyase family 8 super-sandwich domain-containing protein [Paenibacillus plantarum]NOU66290.1 hyaluronate lyase [Paenibacillus plantarum]
MVKGKGRRIWSISFMLLMVFTIMSTYVPQKAFATDEFDTMRAKWKTMLTGGTSYSPTNADISPKIASITATAQDYWTRLNKTPDGTTNYLWSDLTAGTHTSSQVTSGFRRIKDMALATQTYGSPLYGNTQLISDIIMALDWMNTWRYSDTKASYDNWWDWQIGAPMALNDCVVLLYDSLSSAQITNYMNAINKYIPAVNKTGANLSWQATAIMVRAVIIKDSAKLIAARGWLTTLFPNVTTSDGFYEDGSFVQHNVFAYTGGYGANLLVDTANLMYLLKGTTYEITNANQSNVYQWIYKSYQPLLYKGAMMDMVRGREIVRYTSQDREAGHYIMQGIIRLSQIAPTADASRLNSMIKYWIEAENQSTTLNKFYADASINMIVLGQAIMSDSAVVSASELVHYQQLSAMARSVQLRPGYGFGIAMFSNKISSYESINSENGKGWYTGAGATYLYNNDLNQFSEDFWPTVNFYRLPGTTVTSATYAVSQYNAKNWVGGTDLLHVYGVTGMDMGMTTATPSTLNAKKSWFMFDDEIVALGAGITSTDAKSTETIVENRKINSAGSNALTVNGTAQSTTLGWSQSLSGVSTIHLAGNVPGSDIGYYFPTAPAIQAKREARIGNWKQIKSTGITSGTNITRNYLTMWFDHGGYATDQTYQYVILPNKTSAEVTSYANNPNITVLENSASAQAVKENTLNIVGVNFWNDAVSTVGGITSNKKASVMTKETSGELDVSISDPTQANTGSIQVEINKAASGTILADAGITVTQLSPTIKFTVNVNGAKGKAFKAKFSLAPVAATVIVDDADSTGVTLAGSWSIGTNLTNKYGASYLHDGNTYHGLKSAAFTPTLTAAGTYKVYMWWPSHTNRATNAQVDILHAGVTSTVTIDEQQNGGQWNLLGTYTFDAGTSGNVKVRNDGANGYVTADAVKFEPVP